MDGFNALRASSVGASEAAAARVVNKRQVLDAEWAAVEARWQALQTKKEAAQREHGQPEEQFGEDDMVRINIGGTPMDVRRSTLTLPAGSLLAALFSGHWDKKLRRDSAGRIFIDDNPRCFEKVVSTLMTHKMDPDAPITPPKIEAHQQPYLESMLDFYGLTSYFSGHKLLDDEGANAKLMEWLGHPQSFELLYKATDDGWAPEMFHGYCDNQGETVTIVEVDNKYKIVGYASQAWESRNATFSAPQSFVFVPYNSKKLSTETLSDLRGNGPSFVNGMSVSLNAASSSGSITLSPSTLFSKSGSYRRAAKDITVYKIVRDASPSPSSPVTKPAAAASVACQNEPIEQEAVAALFRGLDEEKTALLIARKRCTLAKQAWEDEVDFIKRFTEADETIKLSVSGRPIDVSLRILRAHPDSMLATIFAWDRWHIQQEDLDDEERYLLEVPADAFQKILDNIRLRKLYGKEDAPAVPVPCEDKTEFDTTLTYLYPGMEHEITRHKK